MIKFEIRPLAAGIGLGSVLRFTKGQDRTNYGDRCPVSGSKFLKISAFFEKLLKISGFLPNFMII